MTNEHEVVSADEAWFSREPDGDGVTRPTLWDNATARGFGEAPLVRAVVLQHEAGYVVITTDPEVVAAFLGAEA